MMPEPDQMLNENMEKSVIFMEIVLGSDLHLKVEIVPIL